MLTLFSVCQPCACSLLCTLSLFGLFASSLYLNKLLQATSNSKYASQHPSFCVPWRQKVGLCLTGQGVPIFPNQYKPRRLICLSLTLEEDGRKDNLPLAPHILKVLPITPNPYHSGSRTKTRVGTAQKNVRSTFFMSDRISMHWYPNCGCWKEMDKWKKKKDKMQVFKYQFWIYEESKWNLGMNLWNVFWAHGWSRSSRTVVQRLHESVVLHRYRLGV